VPSAAQPQIVYVQSPAALTQTATVTTSTATSGGGSGGTTAPITDTLASASEVRTSYLLSRNRGIFGTVTTSFRGLLSLAAQTPQRKNLLGE
jgi:hypothetical protein